jgi:hypothetical protein
MFSSQADVNFTVASGQYDQASGKNGAYLYFQLANAIAPTVELTSCTFGEIDNEFILTAFNELMRPVGALLR